MKSVSTFLGPFSKRTETLIKTQPILLSLLILYHGLFAHKAFKLPENVSKYLSSR